MIYKQINTDNIYHSHLCAPPCTEKYLQMISTDTSPHKRINTSKITIYDYYKVNNSETFCLKSLLILLLITVISQKKVQKFGVLSDILRHRLPSSDRSPINLAFEDWHVHLILQVVALDLSTNRE